MILKNAEEEINHQKAHLCSEAISANVGAILDDGPFHKVYEAIIYFLEKKWTALPLHILCSDIRNIWK